MALEQINFDAVGLGDLQGLVDLRILEGRTLEYKRSLYNWDVRGQKAEFVKDVTAMANTAGGHLIIGMGVPRAGELELVGMNGMDVDAEIQRMEAILRTGTAPRLFGVRTRSVRLADGNEVLVMRIPRSYNSPHQVIAENMNKFWLRSSNGCYEPQVEELRAMFTATSGFQDRFQGFVDERLRAIAENRGHISIAQHEGHAVLHIVPLDAFTRSGGIDPEAVQARHTFGPMAVRDYGGRINFHGFVNFRGGPECYGYTQVYRNGIVESVTAGIVRPADGDGPSRVWGSSLIADLVFGTRRFMDGLQALGVNPPFLIQITLLGVGRCLLMLPDVPEGNRPRDQRGAQPLNPPTLRLPWVEIPDFMDHAGYDRALKDAMDAFVNAAGEARCKYYDAEGRFTIPPGY